MAGSSFAVGEPSGGVFKPFWCGMLDCGMTTDLRTMPIAHAQARTEHDRSADFLDWPGMAAVANSSSSDGELRAMCRVSVTHGQFK